MAASAIPINSIILLIATDSWKCMTLHMSPTWWRHVVQYATVYDRMQQQISNYNYNTRGRNAQDPPNPSRRLFCSDDISDEDIDDTEGAMTCYSSRAFMWYRFRFCALKTLGGVSRTKFHTKRLGRTDGRTDRQTENNIPGSGDNDQFVIATYLFDIRQIVLKCNFIKQTTFLVRLCLRYGGCNV